MDVSIQFNDQRRLVTVKVNDEPCNDLLSPEMDSQLIRTQFLPDASQFSQQESCRGDSLHFRFLKMERCPKDRGVALKFFFCDCLTWDDVFDWHGVILMQPPRLP